MTLIELGTALILFQQEAAPAEVATERRTGISLRSLLPSSTSGSITHRDTGSPEANADASPKHADPSLNVSMRFDLGPFDGPTHGMLSVEFNRVGYDVVQEGLPHIKGDMGEWLAVEVLAGAEWMDEKRSRFGGGLSVGFHQITYGLAVDGIYDIDENMGMISFGLQLYGEYSLSSWFRIGAELRTAYLTTGSSGGDATSDTGENGQGSTVSVGSWVTWAPSPRVSLRLGIALWEGRADWDVTPFLLTSPTATSHLKVTTSGPILGLEIGF